jgi:hypothetical protein
VVLVVATAMTEQDILESVSFTQPPNDALDLYREGGDSFVSSVTKGGQYLASFTFSATTGDQFTSLENITNTEFSGWGINFSADFEVRLNKITSSSSITYSIDQQTIGFSQALPSTVDQIVTFVENWGTVPITQPAVFDFSTSSYSTVWGCPSQFSQVDVYRKAYVDPLGSVPRISDYELMANEALTQISSVSALYNHYGCISVDPRLQNVPPALKAMNSSIAAWRELVDQDPTNPNIPAPSINTDILSIPSPVYTIVVEAQVGGSGGDGFTDVYLPQIAQGILPTQIVIRGDAWMNRLTTWYAVQTGTLNSPLAHGGDEGADCPAIQFGPGEFVTSITAHYGSFVNQLTIVTNLNPNGVSYPPNPQSTGPPQTFTTPANSAFVGWAGKSGVYVDSLTPMYVQFAPCTWTPPSSIAARAIAQAEAPPPSKGELKDRMPGVNPIANVVETWARANWAQIKQAYAQKGGWERWAQVELANAFNTAFPLPAVQREQRPYMNNALLADMTMTLTGEMSQIIELKCESLWQDGYGTGRFWGALEGDMWKIRNNPLKLQYIPGRVWTIGISVVTQVTQAGLAYQWPKAWGVSYVELTKNDGDGYWLCIWYMHKDQLTQSQEVKESEPESLELVTN